MAELVRADDWTPGAWSHDAVMDMQAGLDPVRMTQFADDWQAAVDEIRDVLAELSRRVGAQLDEGWRGQGADASVAALRRYVAGSLEGLIACRSLAGRLGEFSAAAGELRACMTAPGGPDAADDRLTEALSQVRELYSQPAVAAGNAVADIPSPPEPFQLDGRADAEGVPAATAPTGSSMPPAQPGAVAGLTPSPGLPGEGTPRSSAPAADTSALLRAPTHSAALSPPVAALSPPVADLPLSSPHPPSAPPTAPPSGAPIGPNPVQPVAGRPSAPSAVTPFLGTPYAGFPGRDDGTEHRVPRYLISAGNTDELVGELPLVAPPVIGE
jgi:hypothetical protein